MSDQNSVRTRARAGRALASVAAVAFLVTGGVGTAALRSSTPAFAQSTSPASPAVNDNPGAFSFADVIGKVKPSVVAVRVRLESTASDNLPFSSRDLDQIPPQLRNLFRFFDENRRPQSHSGQVLGSGFFISADGYVVTNNHVVEHAGSVQVTTDDGRTLPAKVIGTDPKTDLALLKVTEGGNFPFVHLATSEPRVGDWVVAIGNPFGLGGTVTAGIVSARGRDIGESQYDDFLQIDAPINKGNSGGPTFNLAGEVVGVNTAIYSPSGGSVGLAFAIPSDTVQSIVAQLEKDGKVIRGYLGVQIQPLTKDLAEGLGLSSDKGALIDRAEDGTPAADAGLKAGDVITAVNGEAIANARELSRKIAALTPGTSVQLTYLRQGRAQTSNVRLGSVPDEKTASAQTQPESGPQLGLRLAPASSVPGAGDEGVAVLNVDPSSAAAAKGVQEGDVILEVAGQAVATPADVRADVQRARKEGKKALLLRIKNKDGTRFVAIGMAAIG
ncbi:Do family serine endopeptidase [Microvirga sp. M2]|uniref:Do family serine endopeptidase n=1 Tax=Microvirga sp. M2 TaxID=3073270 RepID=UPI0039C19016